ncbi:MAG: NADH-quinone oxidoreductase subunit C [Stellaceae bacterium]
MAKMTNSDCKTPCADLVARLAAIPGSAQAEERGDGLWISAPQLDVEAMAREMKALGYRLVTMTGLAREHGETTIIYHYARRHQYVSFRTSTRGGAIPSLTPMLRMTSWIEREIHDFFAVEFIGHPNLIPLLRPPGVQEGFFREPEPGSVTPVGK